jgi:hypothetical protein
VGSIGGGMGAGALHYIGLDYTAVRVGLAAERIRVSPELWAGIRVMEVSARSELNRAR